MSLHITFYQALTGIKVEPEVAQAVVKSLDEAIDDRYGLHQKILATQPDLKALELALRTEIAKSETALRSEITRAKDETLRWVIGLGLTGFGIITGLLVTVLRSLPQ